MHYQRLVSPAQYQTVAGFSACNLGDFIGLRKNFFPQTSGNHKMFSLTYKVIVWQVFPCKGGLLKTLEGFRGGPLKFAWKMKTCGGGRGDRESRCTVVCMSQFHCENEVKKEHKVQTNRL